MFSELSNFDKKTAVWTLMPSNRFFKLQLLCFLAVLISKIAFLNKENLMRNSQTKVSDCPCDPDHHMFWNKCSSDFFSKNNLWCLDYKITLFLNRITCSHRICKSQMFFTYSFLCLFNFASSISVHFSLGRMWMVDCKYSEVIQSECF